MVYPELSGKTAMRHVVRLLCLFAAWGLVWLTSGCREERPWDEQKVPVISLSGGVIAPGSPQENVRMDSMEINILPQTGSYVVDAVYQLFNTGEATTEWIGFPKHGKADFYVSRRNRVIREFIRFEGWVNGRKELFEEKRPFLRNNSYPFPEPRYTGLMEETRWMAKKIVFPKNALTTVRIRYEAPYKICRDCAIVGRESGRFYLGPSQYWKGNITKAEIVLESPDTDGKHRRMVVWDPGTELCKRIITKTKITYELRQLAPLANGVLGFSQIPYSKTRRFVE